MTVLGKARDTVNSGLRPLGIQVVQGRTTNPAVRTFLPARRTMAAARRAGMPLGEYIDATFAEPGETGAAVDAMLALARLPLPVDRVCEIGPGSGRYLERVIDALHPRVYEIYETADDWLPHLRRYPGAVVRPCDGRTLAGTATASVDLVHAQKVFVYLECWTTLSYLAEMTRVTRPGGAVAFDVVTEECMDPATVAEWVSAGSIFRPVPRGWLLDHLDRSGLTYLGHHLTVLRPGTSELMVFRRRDDG